MQEFKTVPWQAGLDSLDYTLPLEILMGLASEMRHGLDNFELKVGDRVIKLDNRKKEGVVVFVHAWSISHDPQINARAWATLLLFGMKRFRKKLTHQFLQNYNKIILSFAKYR